MRRALQQTGWSLVTLSALGLTGRTFGQTATPPEKGPTQPAQAPGARVQTSERNEPALLEEFRIELAWLGDPLTFSYGLLAHCDGKTVELHGTIPDERVRQRAIQLARAQTRLPLVDALRTHPYHLARRTATETPQELERSALRLLVENCGPAARGFEVRADADGKVLVRGVVASYETKLTVSRTLHLLGGCTCVNNQLTVRSVERDGLTYAQVLDDATYLVAIAPAPRTETSPPAQPSDAAEYRRPQPAVRQVAAAPAPALPSSPSTVQPASPARVVPVALATPQPGASTTTPVVHQEPAAATLGKPYVTMGYVTFPDGDPAPPLAPAAPVPSGPTAAISCELLRQRVLSVCGMAARDVRVVAEGGDRLTVHITLMDSAAGERLSRQILAMPELGPFRVFLQVHSRQ